MTSLRSALQRKGEELDRANDEKEKLRAQLRSARAEMDAARRGGWRGDEASSSSVSSSASSSSRASSSGVSGAEAKALKGERRLLELQLGAARDENAALKKFLKDYGMVWVGEPGAEGAGSGAGAGGVEQAERHARGSERRARSGRLSARAAAARAKSHSPTPRSGSSRRSVGSREITRTNAGRSSAAPLAGAPALPPADAPAQPPAAPAEFRVDIPRLEKSLRELNAAAGEGKGNVLVGPNGERKLVMPTPRRLVLWADGFQVDDAPFRSYAVDASRAFMTDLMDGYFPYEMKDSHPDGVPFKLVNKSEGRYDAGFKAFSGQGARLDGGAGAGASSQTGSEGGGGGGNRGGANVTGLDGGAAGGGGNGDKRANYLAKLPNAVIRNGKVIEVRSEIEAMLGGAKTKDAETTVIDTQLDGALPMDFMSRPHGRRKSPSPTSSSSSTAAAGAAAAAAERRAAMSAADDEVTTLRVKGMDGRKMYVITLRGSDTVGTLRQYLERACAADAEDPNVGLEFQIRGAYPPVAYDDDGVTLRAAGLVPNAALLLKPIPVGA